uniref:HECT-type E3 ubiquitin transferase n=1 Tax=Trypanosoma vivax (strain Y486) TaxID=1055687 RepID=G0TWQ7_TRYVY|nr:putative ubiquitin-protein ligase, fragment [Trypanosoma vivax Y486]
MSQTFSFNGRSRTMNLSLSRDHQPSRETILAQTRARREIRERERRRHNASLCIQRCVRRWMGRLALADCAAAALLKAVNSPQCDGTSTSDEERETGRCLEQLCWDYKFISRARHASVVNVAQRRVYAQVLLGRLSSIACGNSLREELQKCSHGFNTLVQLALEEYSTCSTGEVNNVRQRRDHVNLLDQLFTAAVEAKNGGCILMQTLLFLFDHGVAGNEAIVTLVHKLFVMLPAPVVEQALSSADGLRVLARAVRPALHPQFYLPPTTNVLEVLLGTVCERTVNEVDGAADKVLAEAIVDTAMKHLQSLHDFEPVELLGKLVRLIPIFSPRCKVEAVKKSLWNNWTTCLLRLTLLASKEDTFIRETLYDLHHPCTEGELTRGVYKHSSTYLFSDKYGLRVLEEGICYAIASCHPTVPAPGGKGHAKGSNRETIALHNDSLADANMLCSIFIWPLYHIGMSSAERKVELTTILSKMVHSGRLLRSLWHLYQSFHIASIVRPTNETMMPLLEQTEKSQCLLPPHPSDPLELPGSQHAMAALRTLLFDPYPAISVLLFTLMGYFVDATDFMEGLERCTVINRSEAVLLVVTLKAIVHRAFFNGVSPNGGTDAVAQEALILLSKLYIINETREFVENPSVWISTGDPSFQKKFDSITRETWMSVAAGNAGMNFTDDTHDGSESVDVEADRFWLENGVHVHLPLTAFLLKGDGRSYPRANQPFVARRGCVFADAFERFADMPDSYDMFAVRFRDANDMLEEGYGEGVYREFLVSLCREGFAAEHGLFCLTDNGCVYPNPSSYEVTGDADHLRRFRFLGSMVGRALRDGVLQDVPFALHFRNSILGRNNSISNLKAFDPQLFHYISSIVSMSDDEIRALGLNFTCTIDVLGKVHEVELLHGGRDIPVTRSNCLNYIHLVADFKLNRQSARQTRAFQTGLEHIVDRSLLRLFDSKEVMKLFGGDAESDIDVEDWKRYTQYHDASDAGSTAVEIFWNVVTLMTPVQRKSLLKFATSMNRPPLLGFQFLNPPFKVHVLWDALEDRLPSASTCFSTLKLPPYNDFDIAWRKIIAAIEETEDFGLS